MAKIFASYARKDKKQVQRILGEIHALGFDYWMDMRNLQGGDIWLDEITEAILAHDKFLLFMSSASMASHNVHDEIKIAIKNNKKIIIIRLEMVDIPPSLKKQLSKIQWIDFSAPDWKSRLAISIRSPSKSSSTPASRRKTTVPTPQIKIQKNDIHVAQKIASALELIFSAGGIFYKDQCTAVLAQIDELQNAINSHLQPSSVGYQRLMPKIHLLEKVAAINDLVMEFSETCPPGSRVHRQAIHKELISFLDDLNHEMRA